MVPGYAYGNLSPKLPNHAIHAVPAHIHASGPLSSTRRIVKLVQSTFSTITMHYGEMTVKTLSNFTVISKSGEFT
eukprot:2126021-Rhodomonas_salina.1